MKKLLIVADYNDADYSKDIVCVDDTLFDEFLPLMKAINNFEPYVCRHSCGHICCHNWESFRQNLGEKNLYETYSQFSREYIDNFKDIFMSGLYNPVADIGFGFHTIIEISDVVTGEKYVDWKQDWKSVEEKYSPKVKEYIQKKSEIFNYKRQSDGKPLYDIPFTELTDYEKRLIEKADIFWMDYQ